MEIQYYETYKSFNKLIESIYFDLKTKPGEKLSIEDSKFLLITAINILNSIANLFSSDEKERKKFIDMAYTNANIGIEKLIGKIFLI
jgi:hypothetical protein